MICRETDLKTIWSWTRFCRPFGAFSVLHHHPRLEPWAAFLCRFAAGVGSDAADGWAAVTTIRL